MPPTDRHARARRVASVELAIRNGTFNAKALAEEHGVTVVTIYRDRDAIAQEHEIRGDTTREERRTSILEALRKTREEAMQQVVVPWAAVGGYLRLEATVLGVTSVPPPEPKVEQPDEPEEEPVTIDDMRLKQLREVRAMREDAQSRGSMVSAAKLLESEHQLLRDMESARLAQAERERLAEDDDHIVRRAVAAFERMPETMRRQVHAALSKTLE